MSHVPTVRDLVLGGALALVATVLAFALLAALAGQAVDLPDRD